jgi:hypothetical protein
LEPNCDTGVDTGIHMPERTMTSLERNQNQTSHSWTEQDYKIHEATYMVFVKGVAIFSAHVVVILLLMAYFLV